MYQELKTKAISNISTITAYRNQLNTINNEIRRLSEENVNFKNNLTLLTKSLEVMKVCISKLSEGHINHLNDLVNSMLKQIFDDKNYEVEFLLEDTKNSKVLNILLKETLNSGEVIVTDIHENGGGIQTIVGFILQVYFIIYFKQEPILFLDEQLSALSVNYRENLLQCMSQLVQRYNFTFVGILHDEQIKYSIAEQDSMYVRLYNLEDGEITRMEEYNKEN